MDDGHSLEWNLNWLKEQPAAEEEEEEEVNVNMKYWLIRGGHLNQFSSNAEFR